MFVGPAQSWWQLVSPAWLAGVVAFVLAFAYDEFGALWRAAGCVRRAGSSRDVNPTIMTPDELEAPGARLTQVHSGAMVLIIGDLPWR